VTVKDPMLGIDQVIPELKSGDCVEIPGSYTVKDGDPDPLVNVATADSDQTEPVSDDHEVKVGVEVIEATVDVDPDTLNLEAKIKWVSVYIELPEGYGVEPKPQDENAEVTEADGVNWEDYISLIVISSVELNGQVPAETDPKYDFVSDPKLEDRDENGLPELLVKFDGAEVQGILEVGDEVEITITGLVKSSSAENAETLEFEGKDIIRVIRKGGGKKDKDAEAQPAPAGRPTKSALFQNYPSSINPETWIPYQLAQDVDVVIRIHSISGKLVKTLNLGFKPAGFYTSREKAAHWDGRNEAGERVASGIYFYSIIAGDFSATMKMVVKK
jgi:hypothetical protein